MAPLALVLLYVPCGKLAPGAFRTPPHYDAEGNGAASSPFPVLVGEFQRPRRNLTSLALPKIQS